MRSKDWASLDTFTLGIRVDVSSIREDLKSSIESKAKESHIEDLMTQEFEKYKDTVLQNTPLKFKYEMYKPHI